ncbi:TraB/GumN family protein [Croceicoccus ponticola]|uniref:TraB/GumN family protein n=1 Tax=Croceicoccus ponticola TaxID=2217664 RepID=A0A437H0L1_9SPHN|nr:TraB/GumN family protein [Croceicoccus ponticola]RVQ69181.1 TraB/GumN family protein [Croceicoccus ponticola]
MARQQRVAMKFKSIVRRLALLAAMLGFGSPAMAQEVAFDRAGADPALWVVSDNDTKIYLFGTMHALKPDVVWFDDAVATAFAESDELVLEMLNPEDAEIAPVLQKEATYGPGQGLSKTLTPDQYGRFAKVSTELGIPPQALEQMKPWFAGITLATAPLTKLGYLPDSGAEQVLQAAASERGIRQVGLETFAQQMGFFSNLTEAEQVAFLMSGVDDMAEMEQTFADMERAWATGDTDAAAKLLNDGMDETPVVYDVLLAKRNATWAEWIDARLKQPGTIFLAVGAGHLSGEDSVQVRLAERGFKATRVEY